MNEHLRQHSLTDPVQSATTQAAEGMLRRVWLLAEIEAMVKAGIIAENERFEMIGGEVVPMSPKGATHEWIKMVLNEHFQSIRSASVCVIPETTLRLDEKSFVEPDFCVFSRTVDLAAYNGSRALLAVEISDSSLSYDLGRKISIYAAYGVKEVWVINARTLVTRVHRKPGAIGYAGVTDYDATTQIASMLAPELEVCLAKLGLSPLDT